MEPRISMCFCPLPPPSLWRESQADGNYLELHGSSCSFWAKEAGGISIPELLAKLSVARANCRMTATTCPS